MGALIGIDEAGFGPLLGPLVVSGTVFRVDDSALDQCLWTALRQTCTQNTSRTANKLPIADSKALHRGADDLSPLERTAHVMLAVAGHRPATWRELLTLASPDSIDGLLEYPWYSSADAPLPVSQGVGDIGTRANAVRKNCAEAGVTFAGVCSEVLWEGQYNKLVRSTRNKSTVLVGRMLRVLRRALRLSAERRLRVFVDRLGGRSHYREVLAVEFTGFDLQILEESDTRSAYRLTDARHEIDIEFLVEGEKQHMPIALASVYSKYLRELSMHTFNRYWSAIASDLRPTAGYYSDAMRWLNDAAPLIERMSIKREMLVRER